MTSTGTRCRAGRTRERHQTRSSWPRLFNYFHHIHHNYHSPPTTAYHCLPLLTTAYHCLPLSTTACRRLSPPTAAYHCLSLPTVAYHCLPPPITAYRADRVIYLSPTVMESERPFCSCCKQYKPLDQFKLNPKGNPYRTCQSCSVCP